MSAADDRLQHALGLAFGYLSRRERTVSELRAQLERKDVDAATAKAAIEVLLEDRYLDDARYARVFAEDKRELEGWGTDRIRRTLLQRGIAPELADQLLSDLGAEVELERALSLLKRRFAAPPVDRHDRDRALGFLVRKGYDGELALDALTAYARELREHSGRS
jgi:regulatory protein